MSDALMVVLTGVGLVQVFYLISLLNRIVSGLDRFDARLEAFSQESRAASDPAQHLQARLLQELRSPGRPRP